MSFSVFSAKSLFALSAVLAVAGGSAGMDAQALPWASGKEVDSFDTSAGTVRIIFLGHGSLVIDFSGKVVYVDPVSDYADFSSYPKADAILVTHEHGDHLDKDSIKRLTGGTTRIILPEASRKKLGAGEILGHWASVDAAGVRVTAVPAYNVSPGKTNFHPTSRGDNGYVLEFGGLRIYVSGDSEPIPEMARLGRVDIAFLAMNQPYTMTPEQAAEAARTINPKVLYPYHFGSSDTSALARLLAGSPGIELRLRKLQ